SDDNNSGYTLEDGSMRIENEATFLQAVSKGVNLFLGAGFSILASDKSGRLLPTSGPLAAELRTRFSRSDLTTLDLARLYTVLAAANRDDVDNYLVSRFTVDKFDPRYGVIDGLEVKTIFTTNIDNLVHRIFEQSRRRFINDLDFSGPVG